MKKSQTSPSPLTGEGKGGGVPRKGGGNFLCCLPFNSKGISILFLVIAMLLMVTIGYVFSYLMPSKQKSIIFPIQSTQTFFIAQSGVEYAIRYSSFQGWRTTTDLLQLNNPGVNQRNLGNGRFTISYDNAADTLTSTGEITSSTVRRIVRVSNLSSQFLDVLILDPASAVPCWCWQTQRVRFYIKYTGTNSVTLNAFYATWQETVGRRLRQIYMNGILKYNAPGGLYYNGDPRQNFNAGGGSQTINPGQVIPIIIRWSGNISATNALTIVFYTALGDPYSFTLNLTPPPGGSCAVGC